MRIDEIKKGDRVNVTLNISESWESKAGMHNGIVDRVELKDSKIVLITVYSDVKTKNIDYHRRLHSGSYAMNNGGKSGYTISKV